MLNVTHFAPSFSAKRNEIRIGTSVSLDEGRGKIEHLGEVVKIENPGIVRHDPEKNRPDVIDQVTFRDDHGTETQCEVYYNMGNRGLYNPDLRVNKP